MKRVEGVFRIFLLIVLTLVLSIIMSACGSTKQYYIDEVKLVNDILENVQFDCQLYQVSEDRIGDFISAEGIEKKIMYMGSGSYADTFGIFTFDSEESAKAGLDAVESYLADLEDSFKYYIPEEAEKIANAVVVQKGKYVIFCVTSNSENAAAIIEESFVEVESDESSNKNDSKGDEDEKQEDASDDEVKSEEDTNSQTKYDVIDTTASLEDFGNVVRIGDAAYELYSYSDKVAEKYASYINAASDKLEGISDVYDLIIPLSSGITLPDKYFKEISSSNQKKAVDNLLDKLDSNVKGVNIYDNLMKHRTEYIYFRTDHHWTALGAYYGYEVFCDAKGIIPISLERHESIEFNDFLGSFYESTNKSKKLSKNPDTITAYYPISTDVSLVYTTTNGKSNSWEVIYDVTNYPKSLKYSTFIAGDNPFTVIENDNLEDGSSCVVVKESFGNAFVPFLVDHYQKIYVVDYRYWEGNIVDLAKKNGADDVIFLNNLSMTRSDYLTGKLAQAIE